MHLSFPKIASRWQICLLALFLGGAPLLAYSFPLPIPTRPTSFPLVRPGNLNEFFTGTVVAWGSDLFGETTVPAGLVDVVQVAAGTYHTVALKRDGTVVAWGANYSGQATVPAGLVDVVQVAAGYEHTVALKLADTDDDRLSDWAEINTHKTNPLKADTDGDALSDGA